MDAMSKSASWKSDWLFGLQSRRRGNARVSNAVPDLDLGPAGELDLGRFPPVECVIGYGSGVFRQAGYESRPRPMIDLVFVVRDRDVLPWHRENLSAHPEHYARLLRCLGPSAITSVQRWGPGLYYNPHVHVPLLGGGSVEVKYGVVSVEALLRDLVHWDWLYMAGRLHKPFVLDWRSQDTQLHADLRVAVASNRRSALSASLLLSGAAHAADGESDSVESEASASSSSPTWRGEVGNLLEELTRLSYDGDVRVGLGEDPKKVRNIVKGQLNELCEIYRSVTEDLGVGIDLVWPPADEAFSTGSEILFRRGPLTANGTDVETGSVVSRRLFSELPLALQQRSTFAASAAAPGTHPWAAAPLRASLRRIVFRSSLQQTVKGALTAGASRSVRYAFAKIAKRFK